MANNLAIGLVIGASLAGSFKSSFAGVNSTLDKLGQAVAKNKRDELKGKALGTLASAAVGIGVMKTYMQQEEAANNLKISMMKADGTFGKFKEIGKIADQLGTDLPGTREDFYKLAKAMKMQGVSDDTLINGGLKTSAKLNVLLEMDQEQGGEFFAKMMESHGLSEAELGVSADDMQRAMFAAGMKKDDMYGAMTYYASKVRSMKLTGRENSQKIYAIEGLAAQQGLEGTSFGTNFSTMLDRMSKGPQMIAEAKKGMKAEARDILEKSGVKFDFWDKKGNFKGIDGMVKELEKLEIIRKKFGDQAAEDVADAMFATEGKRVATLLGQQGTKGLQDFLQKMKDQASLEERVAQKTKTLGSALESLGGAWESAIGNVGSVFADDIKSFAKSLQEAVEWFTPFISQHKQAVKFVLGLVAGFVALRGVLQVGSFAIQTVTMAMNALKIATMTNPIGLIITGIAVAAYLIYNNWEPISAWFSNLWTKVTGYFQNFCNWVQGIWTGATEWVSSAWAGVSDYFGQLWNNITTFFNSGIGNITATILNWSPLGLFYQAFSSVLSWFGIDLPAKFTEFGSNLISGLVNGIRNAWDGAKEWVISLGKSIKGWFTGEMEIHSPSRVFKGYGQNIVEGLAIGMDKSEPLAAQASKNLSSAVKFEPVLNGLETAFKPMLNEKKGFFGSLWDDIKFGANFVGNLLGINQPADYRTPDFNPNSSGQNPSIFHDYQPLNRNAVTNNETNQHNGIVVNFNPTIHVGGNQTQGVMEQVQQGLNMSLVEFERLLNRMLDQRQRRAY